MTRTPHAWSRGHSADEAFAADATPQKLRRVLRVKGARVFGFRV